MSTEKSAGLSTPTAILIGSVVISFGLYLGLRSSKSDEQPPPSVAAPTLAQPSAAVVAPVPVPTAKPAPTVDKARVVQQATAALATQDRKSVV